VAPERWFEVHGVRLHARVFSPHGVSTEPEIVLLHEGLGCVEMWREFPHRLAERTGRTVLAYSRAGYGHSDPVALPRALTYMHDEARRVLPAVLDQANVRQAVLVGHSDGGSIALIHAADADPAGRVSGMLLLAPHVFCEDVSVAAIAQARQAYEQGDLRDRLARYHGSNVEVAFWGWNRAWLDPGFRTWNLESLLPKVRANVVVMQGAADPYGTLAQVDAIEVGLARAPGRAPFRRVILPGVGHAPWREREAETLAEVSALCDGALR
jgi:pimeloyl-ACP methyl ester carboxylesterase